MFDGMLDSMSEQAPLDKTSKQSTLRKGRKVHDKTWQEKKLLKALRAAGVLSDLCSKMQKRGFICDLKEWVRDH